MGRPRKKQPKPRVKRPIERVSLLALDFVNFDLNWEYEPAEKHEAKKKQIIRELKTFLVTNWINNIRLFKQIPGEHATTEYKEPLRTPIYLLRHKKFVCLEPYDTDTLERVFPKPSKYPLDLFYDWIWKNFVPIEDAIEYFRPIQTDFKLFFEHIISKSGELDSDFSSFLSRNLGLSHKKINTDVPDRIRLLVSNYYPNYLENVTLKPLLIWKPSKKEIVIDYVQSQTNFEPGLALEIADKYKNGKLDFKKLLRCAKEDCQKLFFAKTLKKDSKHCEKCQEYKKNN